MKFLCLILWLGGVCTDGNDAEADANNTDDARQTKQDCVGFFGIMPNEAKNVM